MRPIAQIFFTQARFLSLRWGIVVCVTLSGCQKPGSASLQWLDGLAAPASAAQVLPWVPQAPADAAASAALAWHALWVAQGGTAALPELLTAGARLTTRIDPVWGGVLEQPAAALGDDLAKTFVSQALALEVFATLYWASGEQRFANAFVQVDEYLQDWLRLRDGGYAQGQLARPAELRPGLSAADYWGMRREHDRRSFGIPATRGQADSGALLALARAYLVAANAFKDANYLAAAGSLLQDPVVVPDTVCSSAPLRLGLQLKLWQHSGSTARLARLQSALQTLLEARLEQDHCAAAERSDAAGRIALAATLQAFSLATAELTLNDAPALLVQQALLAARGLAPNAQIPILTTAKGLIAGPVAYLLQGKASDPRWQFLHALARTPWEPRAQLVLHNAAAAQPAVLQICSPSLCALPIEAAAEPAPSVAAIRSALAQLQLTEPVAIPDQIPGLLGLPAVQGFASTAPSGVVR
ncbi:MAG: hypothetical protein AB8B93_00220 [Pseudomonadales bacterium]